MSEPILYEGRGVTPNVRLAVRAAGQRPEARPEEETSLLKDGHDLIADTSFIHKHLEKKYKLKLGGQLDEARAAKAELLSKAIEDHLYWAQVRFRWEDHPAKVRDGFFGSVPGLLRQFVFNMVKKQVTQALWGQGLGRHSRAEVLSLTEPSWQAIAYELGDAPFLGGDEPIVADASLYGLVTNILAPDLPTPLADQVTRFKSLLAHQKRMAKRFPIGDGI